MLETKPLSSVHDALNNAVFALPARGTPASFRIELEVKTAAMEICTRHGASLSEYLRQCCIALVNDYSDPDRA